MTPFLLKQFRNFYSVSVLGQINGDSCKITNMNKLRNDLMSGFIKGLDNDVDLYSRTTDHSGLGSPKIGVLD